MHVYNLCRICLTEDINTSTMQPLFGKDEACSKIVQRIEVCGGIVLKPLDQFPKVICAQCVDKLDVSYKFRSMCQASERALLDTIVKSEMKQESQDYDVSKVREDNDNEMYFDMHTEFIDPQEMPLQDITETIEEEVFESDMEPNVESAEEFIEYSDSECFEKELSNTVVRQSKSPALNKRKATTNTTKRNATSTSDKTARKRGRPNGNQAVTSTRTKLNCGKTSNRGRKNNDESEGVVNIKTELNCGKKSNHGSKEKDEPRVISIKTEPNCGKKNNRGRKKKDKSETASIMCEICGNIYPKRGLLNMHMRRHQAVKPFECEMCGKTFAAASEINRHMRIHTGEKPYVCKYCGRAFADHSTHIKHERIHTNERPFTCQTCGKSFSYSNVLKNHMLTHTGEKPFACEPCNKTFSCKHQLNQHIATITHQQTVSGRQSTTNASSKAAK